MAQIVCSPIGPFGALLESLVAPSLETIFLGEERGGGTHHIFFPGLTAAVSDPAWKAMESQHRHRGNALALRVLLGVRVCLFLSVSVHI